MNLTLFTWNSLNINNATPFTSYFPKGQKANLSANPVTVNRAGDFPFLSDSVLTAPQLQIGVIIAPGQNINTNRELLKKYFNVTDRTRHNLIAKDSDDSDKQYYVTGFPVRINNLGNNENQFTVTLALEYPYWQLVTATTDNWSITASGDTKAVTNAGNIKVPPVFTFVPTTTKGAGLTYRRLVTVYNNLDRSLKFPLDITDGGIDTAALVTAVKMQADGDDFLVWMDGGFADRWLDGIDTTTTQCWINFAMQHRNEGTLGTTVNASVTTLVFTQTNDNLKFLRRLKKVSNRVLLIESEAITFTAANVDLIGYQITSVVRGEKGTTAAGHTAPITVRHLEHDLWILYGDSTLTAPDVNDNNKPMFDTDSTNASLVYSEYYDTTSSRPGAWKSEIQYSKTGLSYAFTANQNTFANPASKLGLAMIGGGDFQVANESGLMDWLFTHPCGITNVLYSGSKYFVSGWPVIVGLQYLEPNVAWFTANNEAVPGTASTWTAFGPHNIALGGTYEAIRFAIDGQLDSVVDDKAMAQFDTTTVTISSSNLPTIALGSEEAANFFDITLTNSTTGEYIKVQCPCLVDDTLTVDCENKQAYLSDGSPVRVSLSSDREAWLNLNSGANTIEFVDVGTVAVTATIVHRDRNL